MIGCFGKIGSVASDIVAPIIYRSTNSIEYSFWNCVIINALALIIVLILNVIDNANDRRRKELRYLRKTAVAKIRIMASVSAYSLESSFSSNLTSN